MSLELRSDAFEPGGTIPVVYTYDGEDRSPPLAWEGVPERAKTLALIVEDPDAPSGTFLHWTAYNIPASEGGLEEGMEHRGDKTEGTLQGRNDFDRLGYGGPAPPPGKPHRYVFRLFALDDRLDLDPGIKRQQLEEAMQGHILEQAELVGRFGR